MHFFSLLSMLHVLPIASFLIWNLIIFSEECKLRNSLWWHFFGPIISPPLCLKILLSTLFSNTLSLPAELETKLNIHLTKLNPLGNIQYSTPTPNLIEIHWTISEKKTWERRIDVLFLYTFILCAVCKETVNNLLKWRSCWRRVRSYFDHD
jgi:hypothetical protein